MSENKKLPLGIAMLRRVYIPPNVLKLILTTLRREEYPLNVWERERKTFAECYYDETKMRKLLGKIVSSSQKETIDALIRVKYIIWPVVHDAIARGDAKTVDRLIRVSGIGKRWNNPLVDVPLMELDPTYKRSTYVDFSRLLLREEKLPGFRDRPWLTSAESVQMFNVLERFDLIDVHAMMLRVLEGNIQELDGILTPPRIATLLEYYELPNMSLEELRVWALERVQGGPHSSEG